MSISNKDYLSTTTTISIGIQLRRSLFQLFATLLILVLTGLVACVDNDSQTRERNNIYKDIDRLLEQYFVAYNAYDASAVAAVITEGYVLYMGHSYAVETVSSPVDVGYNAEQMLSSVEGYNKTHEYQFKRIGDPIITGDGPWIVSQVIFETSTDHPNGVSGISTFTVVKEDGVFKVARDIYVAFIPE